MRTLLALAIATAPLSAPAQEVTGTITATLDGAERTWFITESQQGSQSDWSDYGYAASVSILGHSIENTVSSSKKAMLISFEVSGDPGAYTLRSPEIRYLSEGMFKGHTADDESGANVVITSMTKDGERLNIEGTFAALLTYEDIMTRTTDPENKMQVDGTFSASVGPVR